MFSDLRSCGRMVMQNEVFRALEVPVVVWLSPPDRIVSRVHELQSDMLPVMHE